MTGKIFISYRRSDSKAITDRIYSWLVEQFGRDAVFYDIDTIGPGVDWRAHIREEVGKARIVLAIISGSWLAEIQARAADPQDVLRFELETALARGISVVPILIERTEMPRAAELPASLARLPDLNAATVHEARYFFTDMDALAERLAAGWGFERRAVAAPGIVGKARPATADLVVPSTYRGPALPPPKVGEKWEKVTWPKLVDKSWTSRLLGKMGSLYIATWTKPKSRFSKFADYSLAISDGYRIGFVDFSSKECEMSRPFTFLESAGSPTGKVRRLPVSSISHLVAIDDGVAFSSGGILSKSSGLGHLHRDDLWVLASESGVFHDREAHLISGENAKGWWIHISSEAYREDNNANRQFLDIYKVAEKLKRVASPPCSPGSGRYWHWSPSGNYAIYGWGFNCYLLVTATRFDEIQFDQIFETNRPQRYLLPLPASHNYIYGGIAWHPTRDIFALSSCQTTNGPAIDWRVSVYDVTTLGLIVSFPVDEPRELRGVAWSATGRYLATGGEGRCIFVFDLLTGATQKCFGHSGTIDSLYFSPDGQRLLSSGDGRCIVWNPENGERVAEWSGGIQFGQVRESPWSPDCEMVATSGLEIRRLVI